MNDPLLSEETYFTTAMEQKYCGHSQYLNFIGSPAYAGCEARALAEINGEYKRDRTKALLIGSILDALWEGASASDLIERFPDCVSTRGATKGQLKAEYKIAFSMYQRGASDPKFSAYMAGDKQVIMTGDINGLPFKIKIDSFHPGKAIVDLKSCESTDLDKRYFVPDSGERLPFYKYFGYDVQFAIYREIVRQNTGDTLPCYIAAIDKTAHPLPVIIYYEPEILDATLEEIKRNTNYINDLKHGIIKPVCRCGKCEYCRDTAKAHVYSTSEFETHDIGGRV